MDLTLDYYHILKIEDAADAHEIKRAYRLLARTYHPDHNPGDMAAMERFKKVQSAYEVLSDDARRRAYDRARRDPFAALSTPASMASFGPGGAGRGGFARTDGEDPLFSFFFGEGDSRTTHGRDLEAQVQLTFDQALG